MPGWEWEFRSSMLSGLPPRLAPGPRAAFIPADTAFINPLSIELMTFRQKNLKTVTFFSGGRIPTRFARKFTEIDRKFAPKGRVDYDFSGFW